MADAPSAALLLPESWEQAADGAATIARYAPTEPNHAASCACCAGRPPIGMALDRLFQARVRGNCPWFGQVLALIPDAEARREVQSVLENDPLTAARFRPG